MIRRHADSARGPRGILAAAALALALSAGPAHGEDAQPAAPAGAERLTGDWGGLRQRLADAGFAFAAASIGEILGNATGGVRRQAVYEGRLELALDIDLARALRWNGAQFHVSAYQIHGRGLSTGALGSNLMVASNIEATRAFRLFTLWLQQDLFDGALQARLGQLAADEEFFVSDSAASFINSTFGWPALLAADLPSGGPTYPLATPGVRLRIAPAAGWTVLAAVFNGDPAGPGDGDPQRRNASGTAFRVNDNVFAIAELAYALNQGENARGQPGTYKLGAWVHGGRFADQHYDDAGLSLADPASSGNPRQRRRNFGFYAIADQTIWRPAGGSEGGLSAFLRLAGAPGDRNLLSFSVDGGFAWRGPIPGRGDDVLALGAAFARVSGDARARDRDSALFAPPGDPVRRWEAAIELTYQAQITPYWMLQPDFQYVFRPGAGVAVATAAGSVVPRNAAIFGLRGVVRL